jgi:hypothetical protein
MPGCGQFTPAKAGQVKRFFQNIYILLRKMSYYCTVNFNHIGGKQKKTWKFDFRQGNPGTILGTKIIPFLTECSFFYKKL